MQYNNSNNNLCKIPWHTMQTVCIIIMTFRKLRVALNGVYTVEEF